MPGLSYQNYRLLLKQRSPEPGFDINIDLKWHGGTVSWMMVKSILSNGVKHATNIYFQEIKKLLSRTWGSVPVSGGRKRVHHSKPYHPPFMQTMNLARSIKKAFHATGSGWNWILRGEIFTLVPYAQTLEYGGIAARIKRKPYAIAKLVNPLEKPIIIAPRPAWRPTFRKNVVRMFKALTKQGLSP